MKKAYVLVLFSIFLLTACTRTSNDAQVFQTIATPNPNATVAPYKFSTNHVENYSNAKEIPMPACRFLIDWSIVRDPGSNISVKTALSLLIEKLRLSTDYPQAYKFLGYDSLEDGTCYLFGYGQMVGTTFKETCRYAVSYNKTIYQAKYKKGNLTSYKEVSSVNSKSTSYKNKISAMIHDGILQIKDKKEQTTNSFVLKRYGLKQISSDDLILMDMNFDGYLDVAIHVTNPDGTDTYHAFLYHKKTGCFTYQAGYSTLPSPKFDSYNKLISCSMIHENELIYDTYQLVGDQPEISKRITYRYDINKKLWRMDHYNGENGELMLLETNYYTTKLVSELTGENLSDN